MDRCLIPFLKLWFLKGTAKIYLARSLPSLWTFKFILRIETNSKVTAPWVFLSRMSSVAVEWPASYGDELWLQDGRWDTTSRRSRDWLEGSQNSKTLIEKYYLIEFSQASSPPHPTLDTTRTLGSARSHQWLNTPVGVWNTESCVHSVRRRGIGAEVKRFEMPVSPFPCHCPDKQRERS